MRKMRSKIAFTIVAALCATSLQAQQAEPLLHEQLLDGVRGVFDRIFGSAADKPASESRPSEPAPPVSVQGPRPEAVPAAASAPVALTAAAQTLSRTLHEAVVRGDFDATLKMLEQGTDIEAKDPGSGASPLHYAVMKGRMQIVELLLTRGADVNSRTRNGTTPLHTAALYARKEIAERLLEQRADINAVSASGATPLALASAARNRPIADMLRERGAK